MRAQDQAVALMLEKYEIASSLFHGFNYKPIVTASPREKLQILGAAADYILNQKDGKERCLKYVTELSQAFALSVPHPEALKIRDDLAFFQAVRSALAKAETTTGKPQEELDTAVKQIVSKAITAGEVIDLFKFAGLQKPDISILSPEFLAEIKGLTHKNLALELLKKLLNDEIRTHQRKNLIQSRHFSEMLEETLARYQNRSIETA